MSRRLRTSRRTLSVVLAIGLVSSSTCIASATDSLETATQQAIQQNPEVQARWHAFVAAGDDRASARGGYLPSVDVNGSAGRASRAFDTRSDFDRGYAELSLSQMLFDGFKVSSGVDRLTHTRLVRYYELLDSVQQTALDALTAYSDVAREREMVKLAQRNLANHQRVFDQIAKRAKAGVGNRADLLQIAGRRSLAETNLLTEAANLHDVTSRFQRIVGRMPMQDMAPVSVSATLPANLRTVLMTAYARNPGFHATFESADAARAALRETRAGYYPRVDLRAHTGLYENMNGFDQRFDPDIRGHETGIELDLNWNLFRGGSDRANERAAASRVAQSVDLRQKACRDLRQTAEIAFNNVQNLNEKMASLREHRDGSEGVIQAYHDQFDIGRRSLLDVLDSENEAFQAERAVVQGEYDLRVARLQTLAAMGQLLPALGLARDGVPTLKDLDAAPVIVDPERTCPIADEPDLSLAALTPKDDAASTSETEQPTPEAAPTPAAAAPTENGRDEPQPQ